MSSNTHPDTLADQTRSIVAKSMRLNERAFEDSREEFHRKYARAYSESLHAGADHDQAHGEALDEALLAFLATWEAGR